jgi:hypothetical protein
MNNNVKLAIVTDNPPVREDVQAWGMCRVNSRLFRALSDHISITVCGSMKQMYKQKDLIEDIKTRCIMGPSFSNFIKYAGHVYPPLLSEEIEFKLVFANAVKKIQNSDANWVFCPCGANPHALWRGLRIAQACKLPIAVYLVDDFLSAALLSRDNTTDIVAKEKVPKWLKQVDQIFVISEGLQAHIQNTYCLESKVLPLPYYPPPESIYKNQEAEENQIIFVGNLSHFYVDGLRQMAQCIEEFNKKNKINLKFRFTLPDLNAVKELIGNYNCILCKPCEDDQTLHQAIHSSILCFAPYSFQEKYRVMVSTSFPSKLIDYLSSGRFILIYGPKYTSSASYFQKYKLEKVLTTQDPTTFQNLILQQLSNRKDFNRDYREIVLKHHDPDKIAANIISTLGHLNTPNDW